MDYVLTGTKNPSASWDTLRSQRRKKQKKNFRNSQNGYNDPNIVSSIFIAIRALIILLIKFIIMGAVCYGIYFGYQFLTTSPRFAISQIIFIGNNKVPVKQLQESIGPVTGENIFLVNLEKLSGGLAQHPWIRSTSVRKAYPQSLVVEIKERTPYARIKLDQVYLIDNYGVILGKENPAYRHLPLVIMPPNEKVKFGGKVTVPGVVQSLQTVHYLNKLAFFKGNPIQSAEIDDNSRIIFFTRNKSFKLLMGLDRITEGFQNFLLLQDPLIKNKKNVEYIDLSFKDRIVVKQINGNHSSPQSAKRSN